jgi:aspartate/methionine/tyrosine aminotransferase
MRRMSTALSPRIRATGLPPIPAARVWAARYTGGAGLAIDLTQAVPGYPAHPEFLARIAEAAGSRAAAGYGDIDGDLPLRDALAADLALVYGAPITAADIAITAGCNLAFTMAMTALAGTGEAVMLPAPWYFNHHMALTMLGIDTIPLPCAPDSGFIPNTETAAALLTPATRAIVLITPNNPTGAVYPPETIAAFAALCRERGLWLVLDETYRDFLPEEVAAHRLFNQPGWRDNVIQLYSFSKSYCIPGHRIGAIVAGPAARTELLKVLDTMQICPTRAPQTALAWAVEALRPWRGGNRAIIAERAAAFRAAIAPLDGWTLDALGAYFAYLRLPDHAPNAMQTAEILAAEHGLMTLPGPFFGPGQNRHLRLAFANADLPAIAQVPERLARL